MKKKGKPIVHEELEGFNIKINEFGEMETTVPVDKLNSFLNKFSSHFKSYIYNVFYMKKKLND